MRAPPNSRPVVYRSPGTPRRVGLVVGGKVHAWSICASWNPSGRKLGSVEVLRDATPREVAVGMVL